VGGRGGVGGGVRVGMRLALGRVVPRN